MNNTTSPNSHYPTDDAYNGWTNWETWSAYLWLSDEESSMRQMQKCDTPEAIRRMYISYRQVAAFDKGTPFYRPFGEHSNYKKVNWQEIFDYVQEDLRDTTTSNISPVEFIATAFYYKKDVEKIVRADTPSEYAEIFKLCLYDAGFEIRDFHYTVVAEAISNLLNITNDAAEIKNMSVCTLEDQGYIEADCYTPDLIEWSKDADAIEHINEALQEYGPFTQYTDLLMCAQYNHKRALYEIAFNAVQSFLSQVETGEITTN